MNKILDEEPSSYKVTVRQLKLHVNENPIVDPFQCQFHYHHDAPFKIQRSLSTVDETEYEDELEYETKLTIPELCEKISSASCHKRIRGIQRTINRAEKVAQQTQDERGLLQCNIRVQEDMGATHCITNNKSILRNYKTLNKSIQINGIERDNVAVIATGIGFLPIVFDDGEVIYAKCLYSENADTTLISPTAISNQYGNTYHGWAMYADLVNNTGYMQLLHKDGINHAKLPMYCESGLWYHYLNTNIQGVTQPIIRKLSSQSEFELWHQRMGHPNTTVLQKMHKYARGIPQLKEPAFYKCQSCSLCKIRKDTTTRTRGTIAPTIKPTEKLHPGQHLHMDFGFLRGSAFSAKNKDGQLITSIDGFRSYLIVVDRATRYKWIFLTTTRHPPLKEIKTILTKYQTITDKLHCTIRTDQGGELGKSTAFRELVKEHNYTYEPTGSNSSKQNGMAEKPNQDLKRITKCLLHAAGLDSSYWSYALNHATYLANRTFHNSIQMTPFQAMHNTQPDLSHLKIFGSRCYFKHTKKNQKDLDIAGEVGTFLGYTATTKNVYIQSERTKQFHVALHKTFDEAFVTAPTDNLPPLAVALQKLGYNNSGSNPTDATTIINESTLKVKLLSTNATPPTRSTPSSAGLDLYSTIDTVVQPQEHVIIPLDIAIEPSQSTYAQICTRSSFAAQGVNVVGGVIDADYRGNVKVIIQNNSKSPFQINANQRIAQLILKKISLPKVELVESITATERADKGFGSTEGAHIPQLQPTKLHNAHKESVSISTAKVKDEFIFDSNPYENIIKIKLENYGDHPSRGLDVTYNEKFEKLQLLACAKGTPAGKLDKWRSTIKNGLILAVNDTKIKTSAELRRAISNCKQPHISLEIGTMEKHAMHPQTGVPQLYFDQLHHIGRHLFEMRYDPDWMSDEHIEEGPIIRRLKGGIVPKGRQRGAKLTRRKLMQRDDWPEWEKSEVKQLDQYYKQQMFSEPMPLPPHANVLPFLWTYIIKDDKTKKARCVCNGAPSKGTVTLGPTYAGSLDQTGARIFWATAALRNLKVYGADVSNAFAEAPPPVAPLYITIDRQYKQWYENKFKKKIPDGHVVKVRRALQGHPEAARLWSQLIDKLLREKLHLKPTTHEPCLYSGKYDNTDVLFLRQVDDFAIACPEEKIAKGMIDEINNYMSVQIKYLGLLTRYNGVDVDQRREYIQIYNTTYIDKILKGHKKSWMRDSHCHHQPIPMRSESSYVRNLEQAIPPETTLGKLSLQREMKMNYRQAVGELIYAMVTCRPDISFPLIKLSQYSTNPAREHYQAIQQLFYYLECTKSEGITYWRPQYNDDLPPSNRSYDTESTASEARYQDNPMTLKCATDSDWGGDSKHRKSVTGYVIKLAGAAIYFKSRFQQTIALSSCEAEFVAATDSGKAILYIRTILEEIGVPQQQATILHIDNNGALNMANQSQPTRNTRHMELKHFTIQQWVERDILYLKRISSEHNYADAMTKVMGRNKFYQHFDYIMGRIKPTYAELDANL